MNPEVTSYTAKRKDPKTFFSYGLMRRCHEIRKEFIAWQSSVKPDPSLTTVIDFGCSGGEMLEHLSNEFPGSFASAIGVDLFREGYPVPTHSPKVEFIQHHLARDFPYPFESNSVDFAIVSAYLKHNPLPVSFLRELHRLLKPDGRAVLLDPCPLVVLLGVHLGYFDPEYTMSPWSARTLNGIFQRDGIGLTILHKRRYWIAPNRAMFELGIERPVPAFVRNHVGLHQCVVITRSGE